MSFIIECRNKTADVKHQAGDWETILGENVSINPGDQLYVKNSFIDTNLSTNEKINILNDTTITLNYGFYNVLNNNYGLLKWNNNDAPDLTYEPLVLTYESVFNNPDPRNLLDNCTSESADGINASKNVPLVKFNYTDFDGVDRTIEFPVGIVVPGTKFKLPALNGIITNGVGTFEPPLDVLETTFNVKLTPNYTNLDNYRVCLPVEFGTTFVIPAGTYDPDKLCSLINFQMTDNTEPTNFFPVQPQGTLNCMANIQNNFFGDLEGGGPQKNKMFLVPPEVNNNFIVEPKVSRNYASPPTADDLYTGASQVELAYNQATRTFEIRYIHTPFYYQSQPAAQLIKSGNPGVPIFRNSSQSGIFLTNLTARDKNGFTNFWELLGFDPVSSPNLFPPITFEVIPYTPGSDDIIVPRIGLKVGENITEGLITNDTVIDKSSPLKPFDANPITSTVGIDDTTPIEAGISVLENEDKFGYFIVEIGHKLQNDFLTQENNYRNFQQIVSRYFVQNSYTSGTSDGSLIYTHEGEPTLLQSFRCRILNSDKKLAPNIGDDNTIHLLLVRADPTPGIPPELQQKKEEKKDEKK